MAIDSNGDVITTENNDDIDLDLELENEGGEGSKEDNKGGKPARSDEDSLAFFERRAAQLRKKLGKEGGEVKPKEDKPEPTKSGELDYGQKAYLRAEGIKRGEEENLAREMMINTGKSLEEVLDSKYFQAELRDLRESIATREAVPNGSKRTGQSSRNDVEYWLAKGELPPADEVELRRKVVNAKIKQRTETNVFSQNPVVR